MPNRYNNSPCSLLSEIDAKIASDTREVIKASRELLRKGPADTFLGRETHTPFSTQDDLEEAVSRHAPSLCGASDVH